MLGNARTERRGPVPALCCAIPLDAPDPHRTLTHVIRHRHTDKHESI